MNYNNTLLPKYKILNMKNTKIIFIFRLHRYHKEIQVDIFTFFSIRTRSFLAP